MKILKILGVVIGSSLGMFLLMFLLFPYINKDKYFELLNTQPSHYENGQPAFAGFLSPEEVREWKKEIDRLQVAKNSLIQAIDSLTRANEELREEIQEWENMEDFFQLAENKEQSGGQEELVFLESEDFSERVKSLLNLDEEELAPIVRELDNHQLVRLYRHGGNIQREKLLRSLEPSRAASLMREVML